MTLAFQARRIARVIGGRDTASRDLFERDLGFGLDDPFAGAYTIFADRLDDIETVAVRGELIGHDAHRAVRLQAIGGDDFVDPGHLVPTYITELTGITDEVLFGSPKIDSLLPQLLDFLGTPDETVLVAQNAPFDLSFLTSAARAAALPWPPYPVLDTAIIARKVLTRDEVPNCQLATLAHFCGADTTPNHRALDDARATLDVFHGLLERLGSFDIHTLEELLNFSKRSKKPKSPESKQPID